MKLALALVLLACTAAFAGTVTTTYDPDEFEVVRKNKGTQFMPYNKVTKFEAYSTQSYQGMRKHFQLDNR